MATLNVPYTRDVDPLTPVEAISQWQQIDHQKTMEDLAQKQEQRLGQQAEREQKSGDLKYQMDAHNALKSVMTDFKSSLERRAKELKLSPDSPEYQQLANAMYSNNYDKTVFNITGKAHDPKTNIDLNAVNSLADMTPTEKLDYELQGRKAELDLAQPYKLEIAQAQAGIDQASQQRQFAQQMQMAQMQNQFASQRDDRNFEQQYARDLQNRNWQIEDFEKQIGAKKELVQLQHDLKGNAPVKVPAKITDAYIQNRAAIHKIDSALKMVGSNPNALGLGNMVGDTITQRTDPEGVSTRAIIADIGSLKIHDRSGAAVTASEAPRLKPFIPNVTDTPETVIKKLEQFKAEYEAINNDINAMYSEGLKPINSQVRVNQQQQQAITSNSIPMPANGDENSWNEFLRLKGLK